MRLCGWLSLGSCMWVGFLEILFYQFIRSLSIYPSLKTKWNTNTIKTTKFALRHIHLQRISVTLNICINQKFLVNTSHIYTLWSICLFNNIVKFSIRTDRKADEEKEEHKLQHIFFCVFILKLKRTTEIKIHTSWLTFITIKKMDFSCRLTFITIL